MNQYLIEWLRICQQVSDSALARQSHQPMTWKTGSKHIAHLFQVIQVISYTSDIIESEQLHHIIALPSSLIVSYCMTNRMWVRLFYVLARHSHQSCLILWPKVGEWDCFITLPGTLMNHVSSHVWQEVSETGWFLFQAPSSIVSHSMTKSGWVRLLYVFARHSHQSCLIPWPTVCE